MNNRRGENVLIIIDCNKDIREVDLNSFNKDLISFGRNPDCDIVFSSQIVSYDHGFLQFNEDNLYIYDSNSTNGLFVNSRLFKTDETGTSDVHPLRDGDIIRIDNGNLENRHSLGVLMMYTKRKSRGSWQKLFIGDKPKIKIGRGTENDIRLNGVSVSRQHAAVVLNNGIPFIEDYNSANGVFVNGQRVIGKMQLHEKDIILIANSMLFFTSGMLLYKSNIGGTRVVMQDISRAVTVKKEKRLILQDVSLTVEPNEFVAIIGGSGAGKSTVMNAMSGFEQATSGNVYVNGTNLYRNYQVLKNIIGYVPQQDIIYENISLQKMLEYSAKMRMSDDVTDAERQARVTEVLQMVELEEHKDKFIRSLSGGQKKRASIAVELLADPGLFFLDEPTSGLDPGTEESLMKTLNSLAKQKGKTIVMVTHTTQNLHLCDKILFMGQGGKICFYGSPSECMTFFGVDNLTEIYNKAQTQQDVDKWNAKYLREYGSHPKSQRQSHSDQTGSQKKASFMKQFGVLSARYITLIKNDTQKLMMVFLQPLLIAILLALVANDDVFEVYNSTQSILFALTCAGIWVGLFNSIQEICKERNILKREYMANLRLGAYVLSKFVVQFILSFIQAVIMLGIFVLLVGMPETGVETDSPFMQMFITMLLTIFSSSAIGLIVSAVSKNSDKAMTYAPFLLIIQLLFSGILFELKGITEKIAYLTVSRWSISSFGTISNLNNLKTTMTTTQNGVETTMEVAAKFKEVYEYVMSNLTSAWFVLILFVVICFGASIYILKGVSKDSR